VTKDELVETLDEWPHTAIVVSNELEKSLWSSKDVALIYNRAGRYMRYKGILIFPVKDLSAVKESMGADDPI
jgi:hypothetical protein